MRGDRDPRIGILADDLTSAADGAAPFVAHGLCAMIGRRRIPRAESQVFAVDSGSRSLSARRAAMRVECLAAELADRDIFFKTVDSTLRGNVTVELDAAFKAGRRKRLVFAPAFPAAGRTTIGGVQLVDGIAVSETHYGRDPAHPALQSRLAELVPSSIADALILDAATQAELDAQVLALPEPESILWAGSPGMAAALAKRLGGAWQSSAPGIAVVGELLVVIGSANPVSQGQAEKAAQEPAVTLLRAPPRRQDDPADVLRGIAQDAAARLFGGPFAALIATGGDTVDAILDRLGVEAMEMLHEIEPGFPLGRVTLADGRDLLVAMKAGGFGDEEALRRAIVHLRRNSTERMSR